MTLSSSEEEHQNEAALPSGLRPHNCHSSLSDDRRQSTKLKTTDHTANLQPTMPTTPTWPGPAPTILTIPHAATHLQPWLTHVQSQHQTTQPRRPTLTTTAGTLNKLNDRDGTTTPPPSETPAKTALRIKPGTVPTIRLKLRKTEDLKNTNAFENDFTAVGAELNPIW